MIVIVTRDVTPRFRGFLSSCMLEIGPCVYTAPHMTSGVRERIWATLSEWYTQLGGGSIVMTWKDKRAPGGQAILSLGCPPITIKECVGICLAYHPHKSSDLESDINS